MRNKRVWMYWLFGALLTAVMFAGLKFVTNFRFENSDDILMVKAFMGFEGGQPANFSLYLHTFSGMGAVRHKPYRAKYSLVFPVSAGTAVFKRHCAVQGIFSTGGKTQAAL